MSEEKAIALLKAKNQRVSAPRVALLAFFLDCSKSLSLAEIQRQFRKMLDRVTIYRTLQTFAEIGLLYKIYDQSGNALYFFHENEASLHPHFKCRYCEAVVCFPDLYTALAGNMPDQVISL